MKVIFLAVWLITQTDHPRRLYFTTLAILGISWRLCRVSWIWHSEPQNGSSETKTTFYEVCVITVWNLVI